MNNREKEHPVYKSAQRAVELQAWDEVDSIEARDGSDWF